MGIKGLWKILKGKEVENVEMKDTTLCVDGNFVLFACLGSSDVRYVTEYTLEKVGRLISRGIDPIVVFDGKKPLYKRSKIDPERLEQRIYTGYNKEIEIDTEEWKDLLERKYPEKEDDEEGNEEIEEEIDEQIGEEEEMEEFSNMQIEKITERYKRFQMVKQNRMHGDSSLFYQLRHKRKVEEEKPARKKKTPYHKTEKEIEKLKDLLYEEDASSKNTELLCFYKEKEKEAREKEKEKERGVKPSSVSVPMDFEKSEYQRQVEKYNIPSADKFLGTESVLKSDMSISYKIVTDVLDVLGVKYALSPAESDAIYANIERAVEIDGVITDDSDIFLFSTKPIYRHMFKRSEHAKIYATQECPLEYTWSELVLFSWMLGSDYSTGIRGIGPEKAKKIITEYRKILEKEKEENKDENITERYISTPCVKVVFQTLFPEIEVERYLPALAQTKRIYSETSFKVKIEHLDTKLVSIPELSVFIKKRTNWKNDVSLTFVKMIEQENAKRLERVKK